MKPLLAISAGDPNGIGPEVAVRALRDRRVRAACRAVIIGSAESLRGYGWTPSLAPVIDVGLECGRFAGPSAAGGSISFKSVQIAARLALRGKADAVVTAPVSKESWALARAGFTGHTEYLRHVSGAADATMMFVAGPLRCALVTEHYSIKSLPKAVTARRIISAYRNLERAVKRIGVPHPKIAVCALNPHAGDGGVLGREELDVIAPALKNLGADAPMPSDAAWSAHCAGRRDAILCMYHDQALAPLKLAAREPVVHWTFGLPFIRTSPAHGTAFDIAGKNKADASGMIAAMLFACRLNH